MKNLNKKGSIDKTLIFLLIIVFILSVLVIKDYTNNNKIGKGLNQELSKDA